MTKLDTNTGRYSFFASDFQLLFISQNDIDWINPNLKIRSNLSKHGLIRRTTGVTNASQLNSVLYEIFECPKVK
jgi:hypothetical protein